MARFANKLRAVLSLMCLDSPSSDTSSQTEDNEIQDQAQSRTETHSYPRNTLMCLPTELRMLIYQFALQDVVDDSVAIDRCPAVRQSLPRLGGLALPMISRTIRKESLDVYGPLIKAHHESLWEHYIGLQDAAWQLPAPERYQDLDAEYDAYLHWRAMGCLQRVVNCMWVNDCYVRGYYGELHAEGRMAEWRARV